jgi:polyhydroxyalkanoate synthesis regulator phasin
MQEVSEMAGLIEKTMLVGLGVLTLTRDKVKQFVDKLVEEGDVKAEEAPGIVDKLVARGEEEREELRKLVRQELDKARANIPLVSRKDIEELGQKIDALAAKMDALAGEKPTKKQAGSERV